MKPDLKKGFTAPGLETEIPDDELIDISQVKIYFGVSERTIYNWVAAGYIQKYKVGPKGKNWYKAGEIKRAKKGIPPETPVERSSSSVMTKLLICVAIFIALMIVLYNPTKETFVIVIGILSLFLIFYTGGKINRLPLYEKEKTGLWVLTVIIPVVGFFVVEVLRGRLRKG